MPQQHTLITPKTYWRDAFSRIKRALVGRGNVKLNGRVYRVAYEARGLGTVTNVDYPLLLACAQDKKCVLDLGANVGLTAMLMSQVLAPEGKVFAVEASEATCLVLRENVLLNGLDDRIEIIRAVMGDKPGSLVPFYWDHFSTNASIMGKPASGVPIPLNIVTARLDDLVAHAKLEPDFVKVDVEGAEALVIKGMQQTLIEYRPLVYVELHSWAGHRVSYNTGEIMTTLDGVGYRMMDLKTKKFVHDTSFIDHVGLARYEVVSQGRVLLVPQDVGPPGWLKSFDTSMF